MRISISGTHSTGKTTLLNALKLDRFFHMYTFIEGPTRTLREQGYAINNESDNYDKTQLMCCKIDLENLLCHHTNLLQDRSLLDTYIYTKYLFRENKVSLEVLSVIKAAWVIHTKEHELFLIPSKDDVELVQDGVRNNDREFRESIHKLMIEELHERKLSYHILKGTNEERISKLKRLIQYGNY